MAQWIVADFVALMLRFVIAMANLSFKKPTGVGDSFLPLASLLQEWQRIEFN